MAPYVGWLRLLIFAKLSQRLIEGSPNKVVGSRRESFFGRQNLFYDIREGEMAHSKIMIEAVRFVYGLRKSAPSGNQKKNCSDDKNQ